MVESGDAGQVLGVLSPFLGGWYFGGVLDGIAQAAAAAGAAVVAVQTLDAGTDQLELAEPPHPPHPLAWDHAAGFVVIVNAASAKYLNEIRATGRPVVVVSHDYADVDCPTVFPDNRVGVRAAVEHLIQHGHRRIAFAGFMGALDQQERFATYRETLLAHGITPDPALVYEATDNQRAGGAVAARAMLDAGLPSTAVLTGTDLNAIGMLGVLTEAGCRLPDDQAIVGFDDLSDASFTEPRLTTVRQSLVRIGSTAAEVLLAEIAGAGSSGVTAVARSGPPGGSRAGSGSAAHAGTGSAALDGTSSAALDGTSSAALDGTSSAALDGTSSAALGGNGLPAGPVRHEVATELVVRESCGCPAPEFPESAADAVRSPEVLRAEGRSQYRERTRLQAALRSQYDISLDLLRSHEEDPRQLGWLRRTPARAGCLGLWTETAGAGDQTLDVVGALPGGPRAGDQMLDIVGALPGGPLPPVRASGFPPVAILDAARAEPDALTFVVPVRVRNRDWGLLATVDRVDLQAATGREPINQWAALLTVALDYQAVLGTLREREEQLRESALFDHLTGLPNRAYFMQLLTAAVDRKPGVVVLFVDLDGFKLINDTFGHSVGDRILIEVAERLRAELGTHGTAGRFGGDEFLVLLDALDDGHTPTEVAQRLQVALGRPYRMAGRDLMVTASIGVALADDSAEADAETLVRDADIAMYWAKSRCAGGQAVFDPSMLP
ncbi:diguanylate cyclase domain-containing protein [Actinoplanes sp. NPDC049265]|uniref:diguanylate cyclase domain-containing protein n=1 Tax=Actinoplanes sp. NPDC049265 TaxID=3363902 RepID=UPI00371665A8